jgi:hypothetical protein
MRRLTAVDDFVELRLDVESRGDWLPFTGAWSLASESPDTSAILPQFQNSARSIQQQRQELPKFFNGASKRLLASDSLVLMFATPATSTWLERIGRFIAQPVSSVALGKMKFENSARRCETVLRLWRRFKRTR